MSWNYIVIEVVYEETATQWGEAIVWGMNLNDCEANRLVFELSQKYPNKVFRKERGGIVLFG